MTASGLCALPLDGAYLPAVLAESHATGADVPAGKDRVQDLADRANALVLQAASLNRAPTKVQLQMFMIRQAELAEAHRALQADVAMIGSLVELAAVAVQDCLQN